jgi:hypothetical protein
MAIEGIDDSVELDLQLRIMASVLYTKLAERFNSLCDAARLAGVFIQARLPAEPIVRNAIPMALKCLTGAARMPLVCSRPTPSRPG